MNIKKNDEEEVYIYFRYFSESPYKKSPGLTGGLLTQETEKLLSFC